MISTFWEIWREINNDKCDVVLFAALMTKSAGKI